MCRSAIQARRHIHSRQRQIEVAQLVEASRRRLAARRIPRTSEELAQPTEAIAAYQTVLLLDPTDPAEVHFRLAKLFNATNTQAARQHVLMALEEAPRFREAHELLLKLSAPEPKGTKP